MYEYVPKLRCFLSKLRCNFKTEPRKKNHCSTSFSLCATEVSYQVRWQKKKARADIWELTGRPDLSPKVWCISTPRFPVWMFKIAALELKRHNHRTACPRHSQPKKAMVNEANLCGQKCLRLFSRCLFSECLSEAHSILRLSTRFFLVSSTQRKQIYPLELTGHPGFLMLHLKEKKGNLLILKVSNQVQLDALLICQLSREQFLGKK